MLIKPTKTEAEKPIKNGFKPSVNIFLRFVYHLKIRELVMKHNVMPKNR